MQPTLYGIYSTDSSSPGFFDRKPLSYLKWIVTGDWYEEVRVSVGGTAYIVQRTIKPGYVTFQVGQRLYHVPSDAVQERNLPFARKAAMRLNASSGEKIWSGVKHAGDHVFVNRVAWNFRKPRRGDVMVFATDGIEGLPQGTHYIKRMVGLPGETISVSPPDLLVNGKRAEEPGTIARIENREAAPHPEAGYSNYRGYETIGNTPAPSRAPLRTSRDSIALAGDEYLGMGDNTSNSYDGRFWGAVPARNLLGPGAFVYWPFTSKRFGLVR
jgi:signal peptidase I